MESLRIVQAPRAVLGRIVAAGLSTWEEHERALPWRFPPGQVAAGRPLGVEGDFTDAAGRPLPASPYILAAFRGDDFVGYLILSRSLLAPGPGGHVLIRDLWTDPAHRRTGVATALLERARAVAEEKGRNSVLATVWAHNEASARLFESAGFDLESRDFVAGPRLPLPAAVSERPARRRRRIGWDDLATVALTAALGGFAMGIWLASP